MTGQQFSRASTCTIRPISACGLYRHTFSDTEGVKGGRTLRSTSPCPKLLPGGPTRAPGEVIHPYLPQGDYGLNHPEPRTVDLPTSNEGEASPAPTRKDTGQMTPLWWYACANGSGLPGERLGTPSTAPTTSSPCRLHDDRFLKRPPAKVVRGRFRTLLAVGSGDGGSWYYLDPATNVMATGWSSQGAWYYWAPLRRHATPVVEGLCTTSLVWRCITGWRPAGGLVPPWDLTPCLTGTHTTTAAPTPPDEVGLRA